MNVILLRPRRPVLLLGSGTGLNALRSLVESLRVAPERLTVIYRAHSLEQLTAAHDLAEYCQQREVEIRVLWPDSVSSEEEVLQSMPEIAEHDLYLCGPATWAYRMTDTARHLGVRERRIHAEYTGHAAA